MPMVTLHKVGEGNLYHLHVLDPRTDPGFGGGVGGGADPGYDRPSGGRPDQGLPGGGRPDNSLPGSGGRPDNSLPGQGRPGIPSNELPDTPPPQVQPGATLVLVREGQSGKWHYAVIEPGSPPPRPVPNPPERPDTGGPRPPHASGQPVPPQPTPQRR